MCLFCSPRLGVLSVGHRSEWCLRFPSALAFYAPLLCISYLIFSIDVLERVLQNAPSLYSRSSTVLIDDAVFSFLLTKYLIRTFLLGGYLP